MTDKDKVQQLQERDPAKYEQVDLDRLVIYAAVKLHDSNVSLSLENIIAGAFRLFPKKFSLSSYPEYPDATRVEKALWRSKGKRRQWIGGKTAFGYMITEKSRAIATETETELSSTVASVKQRPPSRTRRSETILRDTLESAAYSKYSAGNSDTITEADFCFLLQGTLESRRETLRENFVSLKKFSTELNQDELIKFLNWLEIRFQDFLKGETHE